MQLTLKLDQTKLFLIRGRGEGLFLITLLMYLSWRWNWSISFLQNSLFPFIYLIFQVGRILQEGDSSFTGPGDSFRRQKRTASLRMSKANASTITQRNTNTIARIPSSSTTTSTSTIERRRRSTRFDSSSRHDSLDTGNNRYNTLSYASSPLDLPFLQQQQGDAGSQPNVGEMLPNVLLDTWEFLDLWISGMLQLLPNVLLIICDCGSSGTLKVNVSYLILSG